MSDERRRKQIERMVKAEVAAGLRTPWWRSTRVIVIEAIAVVGFAISLIQVWPNMLVEPGQPLTQGEAFSVPFRIINGGYFTETINAIVVIHELEVGGMQMNRNTFHAPDFDNQVVERANPKTILIDLEKGEGLPRKAVIAIQVS